MNQPALSGFDWTALDPETRTIVQATTKRLHELERRTGEAIIEIGRGLLDTKQRLGHGQFGAWIEAEFGWSEPTAQRFMRVAEVFQNRQIDGFQPSALYALASGTVPETIRDEFIAKAEAGEPVRHKDVKARLAILNRDTGEIIEPAANDAPPIPYEVVDPSDPVSFLPSPRTPRISPVPPVSHDSARRLSDGLIAAQAPHAVAQAIADANFKARGALRRLTEYPTDVVAEHGDLQDVHDCLDDILTVADRMRETATAIRDQLRAGKRLRAVT